MSARLKCTHLAACRFPRFLDVPERTPSALFWLKCTHLAACLGATLVVLTLGASALAQDAQDSQQVEQSVDVGSLEALRSAEEKEEVVLRKPQTNQGHFIALGVHAATALANDRGRGGRGPAYGPSFNLRLGQEILPWFALGLSFSFMPLGLGDIDDALYLGRLGVHAEVRLDRHWYVHLGFGGGGSGGRDPDDPNYERGRFGAVFTGGAGYNLFLSDPGESGGWTLSPNVGVEVGPDSEFATVAIWGGVDLTLWFGLPKRKLELPIDEAYERE